MDPRSAVPRLDGRIALVTGAASGMGAATARVFAENGATVVLTDIDRSGLGRVVDELQERGLAATGERLDVGDPGEWRDVVERTVKDVGPLTILVNNAGIWIGGGAEQLSLEEWHRLIRVNQTGPFLGMKYCLPTMRAAGGGSIINISSRSGLAGSADGCGYHATKAAVHLMTKQAAVQYASEGIRVNSVHPGMITTSMNEHADMSRTIRAVPLGRAGTATEVAYAVLFLASDESSFITGAQLVVDGGRTAY